MPITLKTPIQTAENYVTPTGIRIRFNGNVDDSSMSYAPCDAAGGILIGAVETSVPLSAADLAVFIGSPGTLFARAEAMLMANQAQLAGVAT